MIERAEALLLRHRLSRTRVFSTGRNGTRASVLFRLQDGDGRVGWGETYHVPGVWPDARAVAAWLVGRDPEALGDELRVVRGAHRWILGAATMAIDDLRARRAGVSVAELFGPRVRDRVRPYASSAGYVEGRPNAEAWQSEAEAVQAAGFRAMKLRVGRDPIAQELAEVRATIDAVPGLCWMADVNAAWAMDELRAHRDAIDELGLGWLEEPLPTDDLAGYAAARSVLAVPIAGGEGLETPGAAMAAITAGAYAIIQPDASICGGISPLLRIALAAAAAGIACVPHACNGAISLAATLQVLAVLPGQPAEVEAGPLLEYDAGENPLRTDLLTTPLAVKDGWIAIPDGPGLGVEVDESVVDRLRAA